MSLGDQCPAPKRLRRDDEGNEAPTMEVAPNSDDDDDMWLTDDDHEDYEQDWLDDPIHEWRQEAATGLWWTLAGRCWFEGHYSWWW